MGWTASGLNVQQQFPQLRHAAAYQAICDFLNDEDAVKGALRALQKAVTAQGVSSTEAFNALLSDIEKSLGFSPNAVKVEHFMTPHDFLTKVQGAQPLIDVGAGSQHGFVTHRVQFVLIALHFEGTVEGVDVVTLYKNLANPNAWRLHDAPQATPAQKYFTDMEDPEHRFVQETASRFTLLWDPLFDLVFNGPGRQRAQNGCCPEYLHDVVGERYPMRGYWS